MPAPLPSFFQAARERGFDPLEIAIAEYRAAFNATPGFLTDIDEFEALAISESYGPALSKLREWSVRPTTARGAEAALLFGLEELANGDHEIAARMMECVVAFLRTQPSAA